MPQVYNSYKQFDDFILDILIDSTGCIIYNLGYSQADMDTRIAVIQHNNLDDNKFQIVSKSETGNLSILNLDNENAKRLGKILNH